MEKLYYQKALAPTVLVVAAVSRFHDGKGDWAAYIDAVKGHSHDSEFIYVVKNGTKLSHELASFLFPDLAQKYTWRV